MRRAPNYPSDRCSTRKHKKSHLMPKKQHDREINPRVVRYLCTWLCARLAVCYCINTHRTNKSSSYIVVPKAGIITARATTPSSNIRGWLRDVCGYDKKRITYVHTNFITYISTAGTLTHASQRNINIASHCANNNNINPEKPHSRAHTHNHNIIRIHAYFI